MVANRLVSVAFLLVFAGCLADESQAPPTDPPTTSSETPTPPSGPFTASSSAFQHQGAIPSKYTCDGQRTLNPPLAFSNLPVNATAVALIMDDPDAPSGTVLHWTFWNLPRNNLTLGEGEKPQSKGARVGREYGGPCPPVGQHRYFFYSFAQTQMLDLPEGSSVSELRSALQGKTAATHTMYGTYTRPNLPPMEG